MIEKIISGGQTGADQAGLEAAYEMRVETGGWAPKGFLTEVGPDPSLCEKYGLDEHKSDKYQPRTYANVKDADATILFLCPMHVNSPGSECTKKAIENYGKPWYTLPVQRGGSGRNEVSELFLSDTVKWIQDNDIKILNIAGNRESKCPGIQRAVKEYMEKLIGKVNEQTITHSSSGSGGTPATEGSDTDNI